MKVLFWVIMFCTSVAAAFDSGGQLLPEQAAYDVTFYNLDLQIDPALQTIAGSNMIYSNLIDPIDFFVFDLEPCYTIDSILVRNDNESFQNCTWIFQNNKNWVNLPRQYAANEKLVIKVVYHGRPPVAANPPWSGGFTWETTSKNEPWISVSCQTEGADIWWPCKDHPSDEPDSMSISLTVPDGLECLSNGQFRKKEQNNNGTATFFWFVSTPINNYCVTLYIAPYDLLQTNYTSVCGDTILINFWLLPESKNRYANALDEFVLHLAFYETVLGPYPFRGDKYGVAEAPYLGMEHQTIIAYGNRQGPSVFGYDFGFDALHFHELAHEWFGNLVTARDWSDFWIHEGFATYMEALYVEYLHGEKSYREIMQHFLQQIQNRQPVAADCSRSAQEMYNGDIYFKGACILHSLRYVLGDEVFMMSLKRFLYPDTNHQCVTDGSLCRLVTSNDYVRILKNLTGQDFSWFFNVYLKQAELPVLHAHIEKTQLILRWEVKEKREFPMPVEIRIRNQNQRIEMPDGSAVVELLPNHIPVVDPDNKILKVLSKTSAVPEIVNHGISGFNLEQNYPNPFNGQTSFRFILPCDTRVQLTIYDLQGKQVAKILDQEMAAGEQQVQWDAGSLPTGTFIYRLETPLFKNSKKLVVLK
ncbi:T9SS type A sorting domain-containing protein [candidate division KSB1 bacterium]|nr:T9SS type A sorting domain-containing protein [candidate division KSB1 bacterium]